MQNKDEHAKGTKKNYQKAINHLKAFLTTNKLNTIGLQSLDYGFASDFKNYLTDSINGISPLVQIDTINALSKVRIKGHMEDWNGAVLNSWNGVLTPTIFDKFKTQQTLGQDPPQVLSFQQQRNKIYRGKFSSQYDQIGTVEGGGATAAAAIAFMLLL